MIRIIGDQRLRAAEWVNQNFGIALDPGDKFTALILENNLAITAAVFYTSWYPANSVQMHIAAIPGRKWLTRPFLSATFRYPFLELKVRRIGAEIIASNTDSLRFARHIGFVDEGIQREAGAGGQDVIALGMLKSECRWLSGPAPEIWSTTYASPTRSDRELSGEVLSGAK